MKKLNDVSACDANKQELLEAMGIEFDTLYMKNWYSTNRATRPIMSFIPLPVNYLKEKDYAIPTVITLVNKLRQ